MKEFGCLLAMILLTSFVFPSILNWVFVIIFLWLVGYNVKNSKNSKRSSVSQKIQKDAPH